MSLIRQVWLLLLTTVAIAFAGSVAIHVGSTRATLETQLRLKNSDNAASLAQLLSQRHSDPALTELQVAAQFDTGFYRRIRVARPDGGTIALREGSTTPLLAPHWFVALLPIESVPGIAQVSDGWRPVGTVEVVSQTGYAYDDLWRASLRSAVALALLGLGGCALAAAGMRRIMKPLDDLVEQAASLQRGEYPTVAEPAVPELGRVTRAMNAMVERLRSVFEAQAAQVEQMRRAAACDPLTGLSNRAHFLAELDAALHREDAAAAGGLVLLRVLQLGDINRAIGRDDTDRLIATVAQTLDAYAQHVRGAVVGRLNGSDFALALPEGGIAEESAHAVMNLLKAELPILAPQGAVAAGAVEMQHGGELAELMGRADLALARAEGAGPFAVVLGQDGADAAWAGAGGQGWQDRLRSALDEGRLRLGHFPVVDASGRLLHLECPLRVQLQPHGGYASAAHWLPLAARSRLTATIDLRALTLALDAIAVDGQPRAVNVAPASLVQSDFASRLRVELLAKARAARHLWIEVSEIAAVEHFELVRELARQIRPAGARFGLEHAGQRLIQLPRLFEAGLDYVKLDASVTRGVAADSGRAGFVRGMVTMLHGLSLQVFGEGVADAADAQTLHDCGLDGLTGPWISAASAVSRPAEVAAGSEDRRSAAEL